MRVLACVVPSDLRCRCAERCPYMLRCYFNLLSDLGGLTASGSRPGANTVCRGERQRADERKTGSPVKFSEEHGKLQRETPFNPQFGEW